MTKVKNFEGSRTGTAGRPRDDTKDEAITSAMIAMLAAHGYDGASFEKVATAAGVSRPAIYRRWKAKELLVIDAVRAMLNEDLAAYTDDTPAHGIAAIRLLMEIVAKRLADPEKARIIVNVIAAAVTRPELATLLGDLEWQRREPLLKAIKEAQATGELSACSDPNLIVEALLGAVYFRRLFSQSKPDGRTTRQVVDGVLGISRLL